MPQSYLLNNISLTGPSRAKEEGTPFYCYHYFFFKYSAALAFESKITFRKENRKTFYNLWSKIDLNILVMLFAFLLF